MSDKLQIIDNLTFYAPISKHKERWVNKIIMKGILWSFIFYAFRAIFIFPLLIFSEFKTSYFNLYLTRFAFNGPSYEEIWNNFKKSYSLVFDNNDFFIKYLIISFILLSIILVYFIKSPSGILISFVVSAISPYIISNVFIPLVSVLYVIFNLVVLFIDNLFPFIPNIFAWGIVGALFGIAGAIKENNSTYRVILVGFLSLVFIISKVSFSINDAVQLKNFFN